MDSQELKPVCKCCKKPYSVYGLLKVENYNIPIVKNAGLYAEHISNFATEEQFCSEKIGVILTKAEQNIVAVRNISNKRWGIKLPNG